MEPDPRTALAPLLSLSIPVGLTDGRIPAGKLRKYHAIRARAFTFLLFTIVMSCGTRGKPPL